MNSQSKKELDIFEETILKLVPLKQCSAGELADFLCLKKDLVNFILIRLTEKGLLEDNQTISEKGKELLDIQKKNRKELEYQQGKLFMIKKTGMILPYVHIGEFQSEYVEGIDASSLWLGYGSAGNHFTVKGSYIKNKEYEKQVSNRLSQGIVKKTIRTYNKIAKTQGIMPISLNDEYGIQSERGENIYFHLQAAVQRGNVDEILFSDGFVPNLDGMMDYISQEAPALINNIKSKAIDMSVHNEEASAEPVHSGKYWELCQLYENTRRILPSMEEEEMALDERVRSDLNQKQIMINCYGMLEWIFYYHLLRNPLSEHSLNLLKRRSISENARTILQFARDLNISYADQCDNLFSHLDEKRINRLYEQKSPELYACLPLAIVEAKENPESEMHELIRNCRSFLKFIHNVNSNCGNLRHNTKADVCRWNSAEVFQKTVQIIDILLPEMKLDGVNPTKKNEDRAHSVFDSSQTRLLAQVSLEKRFGSIFFLSMSADLKNEWLRISPDKKGRQLPDFREYIEILYRIMQSELVEGKNDIRIKADLSKSCALALAEKRYQKKLPPSLSSVGDSFYVHSLKREKSTLGAEALVYYTNVDDSLAEALNGVEYVPVLDRILTLRKHSNLIALNESEQSLNELRDKSIVLSKIIGGYYG
ncbi:MAG: hypothetical protein LUH14_10755 [Clostridiaceae bacterium]|nr:hypothetical protein [Clostridiaceae bacterium]